MTDFINIRDVFDQLILFLISYII